MKKVFYIIIFIPLFIISCKTGKNKYEIPFNKMKEKSIIKFPFSVCKQEFTGLINRLIPDILLERKQDDDFPVTLKIEKGEIIDLSLRDSIFYITATLDLFVAKSKYGITGKSNGSILLSISSDISIDENNRLVTKTSLDSYEWINKPDLKLGFFQIQAPDFVLKYLETQKEEWLIKLDSFLYKEDFLQASMRKIDSLLQFPFPLDSAKSIGARLKLQTISLFPFETVADTISGGINIEFDTEIIPVGKYVNVADSTYKIDLNLNKVCDKEQELVFAVSFTGERLQNVIDVYLDSIPENDRYFEIKNNKIRLDKIDVIFHNGLVGGKAFISGDKNGEILILCRPYWNPNVKKIQLLDRQVKIKMNDIQSKTLMVLFGKTAKKKMADLVEKNINELVYESIYEINDSLLTMNPANTIRIDKFDIPVQVEQDILFIDINLKVGGKYMWKGLGININK